MSGSRATALCASLVVAFYLTVSLRHLDTVPPVHEDEPWIASTGYKLATQGVLGSDLMAGFHGMERRTYGFMPFQPMLDAAVFRMAGCGLVEARLTTVFLGLGALILTGMIAARLFDRAAAVAAMAVLVGVPWLPIAPFRVTGVPLLDQARISRYDMGVATFGLAATLLYLVASQRCSPWRFAAAGAMVAGAGLCNLYGFFWLPVLLAVGVWNRERPRHLAALVLGTVVALLPHAAYVLADLSAWTAQNVQYAPRFNLGDPGWYLANLRNEPWRYGITTLGPLLRPGPLVLMIGVPAAVVALLRRTSGDHARAARPVVVPALGLPLMLAALITIKQPGYLLVVVPIGAIALGWAAVALWRRSRWALRAVLVAVAVSVAFDGAIAVSTIEKLAGTTTPYPELAERIRAEIPTGSRVLALHRFWFGLEDLSVRSWWVPMALADSRTSRATTGLGASLAVIDPDVILLDDRVREALIERPSWAEAVDTFVELGRYTVAATVLDPTYGRIDVYRRFADAARDPTRRAPGGIAAEIRPAPSSSHSVQTQ